MDWCLMIMEIELVSTMKNGLIIAISFALLALIAATGNVIQAVISSVTIGMIIINVAAIVAYLKWELGASESVAVVVCVGFAVDYVVHLASHYIHSKHKDRQSRIREALRELGISIISGSITTILASCVLFICILVLFTKFAIFVCATIVFSLFYSLAFFAAVCHVIGPENDIGDLAYIYRKVVGLIKLTIQYFKEDIKED